MLARRHLSVLVIALLTALSGCGGGNPSSDRTQDSTSTSAFAHADGETSGASIRYLALGDSLTQGVGTVDEKTGAFPALLSKRWRADGCEVELRNVGVSGYTAGQVVADQLPEIKAFRPTLITFQAGGNDIANGVSISEYRKNVATVLDAAKASGARVIVLAQNEWFRSPVGKDYGEGVPAQRIAFDEALIKDAQARGAEFVDLRPLYKKQADDKKWVADGNHPTPEASDAWSAELASAIPVPCR